MLQNEKIFNSEVVLLLPPLGINICLSVIEFWKVHYPVYNNT